MRYALGLGGDAVAAEQARQAAIGEVGMDALHRLADADTRERMLALLIARAAESNRPLPDPATIAAAIRSLFAGRTVRLRDDAAVIVAGAIRLAYLLADPARNDRSAPIDAERRPPWEVANPWLMDVIIWLIQIAVAMW